MRSVCRSEVGVESEGGPGRRVGLRQRGHRQSVVGDVVRDDGAEKGKAGSVR